MRTIKHIIIILLIPFFRVTKKLEYTMTYRNKYRMRYYILYCIKIADFYIYVDNQTYHKIPFFKV